MIRWIRLPLAAFSVCLASCSSTTLRYLPTDATEHTPRQIIGATYLYPPDQTESFVRIDATGFQKIQLPVSKKKVKALRVHVIFSNRDQADWRINLRDLKARASGSQKELEPIDIKADSDLMPWLTIPTNESRIADVFFQFPEGQSSLKGLPKFDFFWKLETSSVAIQFWTPFSVQKAPNRARNLIGAPFLPGNQNAGSMMPGMMR